MSYHIFTVIQSLQYNRVTPDNLEDVLAKLPYQASHFLRFAIGLDVGRLDIHLETMKLRIEGRASGPHATLVVNDWSFVKRIVRSGDIGFAEGYLRKEWDSPDLVRMLELLSKNYVFIQALLSKGSMLQYWYKLQHFLHRNSHFGAKRNIHAHYDLGNQFYEAWLDRTMSYSSALFSRGAKDLADAQTDKYQSLAQQTGLKKDDHILEIGCGWGGFAEYAAKTYGCKVTALTISKQQYHYTSQRIQKSGLQDYVTVKFQDYRNEKGLYDHIISIEMFEAVGEEYWPLYYQTLFKCLKTGGKAGLQIITIKDDYFASYKKNIDFIRHFIFPGGMLPNQAILKDLAKESGFLTVSEKTFALDYAKTLALWRERFQGAWPRLMPLGFDERFYRLWTYYLSYCEAGFRTGHLDVQQVIYQK